MVNPVQLIERVNQFVVHPPEDELELADLQEVQRALQEGDRNEAVNNALAAIGDIFARINQHNPGVLGIQAQQIPVGIDQPAQQAPAIAAAELNPQPQVAAPAANPAARPNREQAAPVRVQAQPVANQEPLLVRIGKAIARAIEAFFNWLSSCFSGRAPVVQDRLPQPEQPPMPIPEAVPQQPAAPNPEPAPLPWLQVLSDRFEEMEGLNVNPVRDSINFLARLWDHIAAGGVGGDEEINAIIDAANEVDFRRIVEFNFANWQPELPAHQNYRALLHRLSAEALINPQQMSSAFLVKGNDVRLILIKAGDMPNDVTYYLFNSQEPVVRAEDPAEFIDDLNVALPWEGDVPLEVHLLRVAAN